MPPAYNVAVDTLADNLRWLLSRKGIDVLEARAQYLREHRLTFSDVDEVRTTIVGILSEAEPVFWPTRFCTIVEQSFATLPLEWRMTDPMLFTPHGYIHFEHPILMASSHPAEDDCHGMTDRVVGIGWSKARGTLFVTMTTWVIPGHDSLLSVFPGDWTGKRISPRMLSQLQRVVRRAESVRPGDVDAMADAMNEIADKDNAEFRRFVLQAHQEVGSLRAGGVPWSITPWRSGQTIAQTLDIHLAAVESSASTTCRFCAESFLRLFATCLNFLSSKVFVSVPSHTDRAVLRRLARGNVQKPQWDSVSVVTLRKAERVTHESDQEETHREWSGHWLVGAASGGHWRHQPMKNANGEWIKQWRWIMPYLKGDLSKPFIPPKKRVFVVER